MTTTATSRIERANQIAQALRTVITDSKCQPRVWASPDGKQVRVYTGNRGEYLAVDAEGNVTRSQSRMAWGMQIDAVLA